MNAQKEISPFLSREKEVPVTIKYVSICVSFYLRTVHIFFCYCSEFSWFFNAMHGSCYVYNSGWNSNQILLEATKEGDRSGE